MEFSRDTLDLKLWYDVCRVQNLIADFAVLHQWCDMSKSQEVRLSAIMLRRMLLDTNEISQCRKIVEPNSIERFKYFELGPNSLSADFIFRGVSYKVKSAMLLPHIRAQRLGVGLDIANLAEVNRIMGSRQQFLAAIVLSIDNFEFTRKHILHYAAYRMGGVHFGTASKLTTGEQSALDFLWRDGPVYGNHDLVNLELSHIGLSVTESLNIVPYQKYCRKHEGKWAGGQLANGSDHGFTEVHGRRLAYFSATKRVP
jgi:hypothetical protein